MKPATSLGAPVFIKNIGVVRSDRHPKVRAIENVEYLGSELHVEVFRNPTDGLFLKKREIKVNKARSGMMFRPALPLKFRHWGAAPIAFSPKIGSEVHIGAEAIGVKNEAGAVGTAKHFCFDVVLRVSGTHQ